MYQVIDGVGCLLRVFHTYKEASNFKSFNRRYDWMIKKV